MKVFLAELLVLATILLAGCDETGTLDETGDPTRYEVEMPSSGGLDTIHTREVELPSGEKILCIIWDGYKAGGMSCDWSGHRGDDPWVN